MIGRQDLRKLGGFSAVSHSILPEGYFGRELVKEDKYSFVRSSAELEVQTTKNFHEQYATAIRTRYPQFRRRPEWTLALAIVNLVFLLLPFGLLLTHHWWPVSLIWLPALSVCLLTFTHIAIVDATDPSSGLLALVTFPLALVTEMIVNHVSMIQYEFFRVKWKDRNICIPVMHVIPKLPVILEK